MFHLESILQTAGTQAVRRLYMPNVPTDDLSAFHRPAKGVKQHMATYPFALFCSVDRQAGKQNDRYVLGPLSFRNSRRNSRGRDATGSRPS